MDKKSKIYIAGHRGMVGSAILRHLTQEGYQNLCFESSRNLDLRDQHQVKHFFEIHQPDYVFLAAAKVGGILANDSYKADFIYDNLMIASNVIHHAHLSKAKKLLFLGSSCIYPKLSRQPIKEEYLLTGLLEETNEPYAIAKIAGIKLCESYRAQYGHNFISAMPSNLYGSNDHYNLKTSHVLPALIRKAHIAKENNDEYLEIWGSGKPRREFLYVDDLAEACVFLMTSYNEKGIINIGTGQDVSIETLAKLICKEVGFQGKLIFDAKKPDGVFQKVMDVSKIKRMGWQASTSLEEGLKMTYTDFLGQHN